MVSDSVYQVVWLINTQIDYQSLLKYENRNVFVFQQLQVKEKMQWNYYLMVKK